MIRRGGQSLTVVLVMLLLTSASAVRASIDISGLWRVDFTANYPIPVGTISYSCLVTVVQSGSNLDLSSSDCSFSTLSGMIDPDTGNLSATIIDNFSLKITYLAGTGTASGFSGTLEYQGPPFGVSGTFVGQHCGNGQIDPGEACDDGNLENGDCCDSTCQFEPSGSACTDNNPCTDDTCDGAGMCTHQNHIGPCDDANQCTSSDACVNGVCTGTAVPDGSACDDSNSCTDESCQGGLCKSVPKAAGTTCPDDGYQCTSDLCDGAGAPASVPDRSV